MEEKKCQKHTTDKQDLIYTLGFELLRLSNEAWHVLHAASIEESQHNVTVSAFSFHNMKRKVYTIGQQEQQNPFCRRYNTENKLFVRKEQIEI